MQFAIAHYRTSADAPLLQHVETASDQATALQQALLIIPINQVVSITLGDETQIPVLKASRAIDLAGSMFNAIEQASAALPSAWRAVDCDVPRELIEQLQRLLEVCRAEGLDPAPRMAPAPVHWTVVCSSGSFQVCAVTGRVLTQLNDMPDDYRSVVAVDVDEYRAFCVRNGLRQACDVSILGVRFFDARNGAWEDAEECFRADLVKAQGGA